MTMQQIASAVVISNPGEEDRQFPRSTISFSTSLQSDFLPSLFLQRCGTPSHFVPLTTPSTSLFGFIAYASVSQTTTQTVSVTIGGPSGQLLLRSLKSPFNVRQNGIEYEGTSSEAICVRITRSFITASCGNCNAILFFFTELKLLGL